MSRRISVHGTAAAHRGQPDSAQRLRQFLDPVVALYDSVYDQDWLGVCRTPPGVSSIGRFRGRHGVTLRLGGRQHCAGAACSNRARSPEASATHVAALATKLRSLRGRDVELSAGVRALTRGVRRSPVRVISSPRATAACPRCAIDPSSWRIRVRNPPSVPQSIKARWTALGLMETPFVGN